MPIVLMDVVIVIQVVMMVEIRRIMLEIEMVARKRMRVMMMVEVVTVITLLDVEIVM